MCTKIHRENTAVVNGLLSPIVGQQGLIPYKGGVWTLTSELVELRQACAWRIDHSMLQYGHAFKALSLLSTYAD